MYADESLPRLRNVDPRVPNPKTFLNVMQRLLDHGQFTGVGVGGYTPAPPPSSLIVTTTRTHSNPLVERALAILNAAQILRVGGAGYKVIQLLEGVASVYVFASPGTKKWDTCAPEAVLAAAGGKLTDLCGNPYKYGAGETKANKTGVLAAVNHELHSYALGLMPQELKDKLAN